jgi:hypothetical protein
MKVYTCIIMFLTVAATAQAKGSGIRDPFWPVGYEPPPPPGSEKPIEEPKPVIKPPEPPKPPAPEPITAKEWKMARKLLRITGYALADKTEGDQTTKTSIVIINGKHYQSGDTVKLTSQEINFVWRVGEIGNNSVNLVQESAVRLKDVVTKETKPISGPASRGSK